MFNGYHGYDLKSTLSHEGLLSKCSTHSFFLVVYGLERSKHFKQLISPDSNLFIAFFYKALTMFRSILRIQVHTDV